MNHGQYRVGATRMFLRELKAHSAKNASVRTHIESFIAIASDPFSRANQPEKLSYERKVGERYSIRLNDDYRIIFDKPTSNHIVYRAIGKHDPTYRRGERLGPVDLDRSLSFPLLAETAKRQATDARKPTPAKLPSELLRTEALTAVPAENLAIAQSKAGLDDTLASVPAEPCVFFDLSADMQKAMMGHLDEWMLFLPEEHKHFVTQRATGPSRIFGASGTGKTCILLHRAVFLARSTDSDVLILTHKATLVGYLSGLLDRLCESDSIARKAIRVASIAECARGCSELWVAIVTSLAVIRMAKAM